jgi:hypothetical protein
MSRPYYEITHDEDGWWSVMRNGGWRCDEFRTRDEAEAAIALYERIDEEAEREAREQDEENDADEEYNARVDYEFDRDR